MKLDRFQKKAYLTFKVVFGLKSWSAANKTFLAPHFHKQ